MTYTVTYGNAGQHMDAENVIITTILPTNTAYIGNGWQSSNGQTYTHTVGYLPAGSTGHTLTFTVAYPDESQIGVPEFNTPFTITTSGSVSRDINLGDNITYAYVGVPDLVVVDFTIEPRPPKPNEPVTFTIKLRNQGTGWALNPDVYPGRAGFYVDIFFASIASYPYIRDGDIYVIPPALAPGAEGTFSFTYNDGFDEQNNQPFYVKADNHALYLYGLVPEFNEMNNVAGPVYLLPYHVYLPVALKNHP